MPVHNHTLSCGGSAIAVDTSISHVSMSDELGFMASASSWYSGHRKNVGSINNNGAGQAHTHSVPQTNTVTVSAMQPYVACYMWKRIG